MSVEDECAALRIFLTAEYDAREGNLPPDAVARRLQDLEPLTRAVLQLASRLPPGARLLDVGTGSGLFALAAASARPAVHVTGIDLSPRAVQAAAAAARAMGLTNCLFQEGDALALPFERATQDIVLCGFAINLVPSKRIALQEAARLLRPGGRLVLAETLALGERGAGEAPGPATRDEWLALVHDAGLRPVAWKDLTPLVRAMRASGAWPWGAHPTEAYDYATWACERIL